MEPNRAPEARLPDNQTNTGPAYAETDKVEPLDERRSQANNFFAVLLLAVPVLLAIMAIVFFTSIRGAQTAQREDREVAIKPTPLPSLAPPVNDAAAASRP